MKNIFKKLLAFGSALLLVGWLAAPYTAGQNVSPNNIEGLGNVNVTSIADGQVLVWSASAAEWQNGAAGPQISLSSLMRVMTFRILYCLRVVCLRLMLVGISLRRLTLSTQ
jgi:hypothetical protein